MAFTAETGFTCRVPLHPVFCFLAISELNVDEDIFLRTVTLILFINVLGDSPHVVAWRCLAAQKLPARHWAIQAERTWVIFSTEVAIPFSLSRSD
jgi:hypothetical protein